MSVLPHGAGAGLVGTRRGEGGPPVIQEPAACGSSSPCARAFCSCGYLAWLLQVIRDGRLVLKDVDLFRDGGDPSEWVEAGP